MEYESQFIRRQNEIQDIIHKLNSNSNGREHEVVTICGKDGLGKTSLVKSIYQNEELRTSFQRRAYVTIKHPFNLEDILDSLVKQLDDKEEVFARKEKDKERGGDRTKLRVKRQRLDDLLNEGKHLIVLDDLSSIKEWDSINLPKTNTEGRIIVTTSTENIAKHSSNKKDENIYKLKCLDKRDALDLFKETVLIIFSFLFAVCLETYILCMKSICLNSCVLAPQVWRTAHLHILICAHCYDQASLKQYS
jgi:hypothetical protein